MTVCENNTSNNVDFKRGDYVVSEIEDYWHKSIWIVKQAWTDSLLCVRPFAIYDYKIMPYYHHGDGVMFNKRDVSPLPVQLIVELKLKGIELPKLI